MHTCGITYPYQHMPTSHVTPVVAMAEPGLLNPIDYTAFLDSFGPIAHWTLGDAALPTAHEEINSPAQDGTHTGVTLGQPGIGDGLTCPLYDGVNDSTDVFSAALAGAFNGSEGTVLLWMRVTNAGVWTDGTRRELFDMGIGGNDRILLRKWTSNNTFLATYIAGGVSDQVNITISSTDWICVAMSWSASADEMRAYVNGAQSGATQVGLGVWGPAPTHALIGASAGVVNLWSGYASHCVLWDRALTPAEIGVIYNNAPWVLADTYAAKVLSYNPIAYWPLWEGAGLTAFDQINSPAQDGTYVGPPTLGQPGIGDGNTCPLFDGANDYTNVLTAALTAAFSGSEGTLMIWARVLNAGVWTDGTDDFIINIGDGGAVQNMVWLYKLVAANTFRYRYRAGGTDEFIDIALSTTDWFQVAITWSAGADEVRGYLNGAQTGATQTGLGAWGAAVSRAIIAAQNATPVTVWNGWLQHVAVWDQALAGPAIADLYVVP